MKRLILASNSPRRREILTKFNYNYEVIVSNAKESNKFSPEETAIDNAFLKAKSVYESLRDKNAVVLGFDTVVNSDEKILGKPKDNSDAERILKSLSGKTHKVITGYAVIFDNGCIKDCDISYVTFNELSKEIIRGYIESGLPMDKAGAYGIQDGYPLVKNYSGSLYNIIGLPIEKVKKVIDGILEK